MQFSAAALLLLLLRIPVELLAQSRTESWGFTSARFDTRTAAFIYTGYGYGPWFALGAVMYNQRSGYTELIGGVGRRFDVDSTTTHFVVSGLAHATDSRYVELYYLPSFTIAGLSVNATLETYVPLDPGGSVQHYVTPASIHKQVTKRIATGASYELAAQRGFAASHFIGPSLRISVARALLTLDAHFALRQGDDKMRVSFLSFH